ncbi:MAG: gliding motility-associated C-terminal domain-containing protein [Bacteroidales bacterium]|nr:gliding motility-associated C-terminal domain-containing protein [Bacteroidales bacterium]
MLSVLTVLLYSQDRKISGIINEYKKVTAIGPGLNNITLADVGNIAQFDTVLLIQMKGSIIYVPETGSYGSYRESIGASGKYEFLIVQSVNPGTKVVDFTNPILNTYDINGLVQLVTVPSYPSATVKGTLTCQPWDSISKTGGVLTMIVGRNLALNANIDVSGKGFYGGAVPATPSSGICLGTATYDNFSYPNSYLNSGFKGESHVTRAWLDLSNIPSIYPTYAKGKGNNFTSGGGGSGRYSGGGGGSNYGLGGKGGKEMASCTPLPGEGGLGGKTVDNTDLEGFLFLGSGGGGSTYESAPTASAGGRGGGIIIIMCETLKGKGKIISADGAQPGTTASGNAGAGGGGGGGSIALYQQSFSTPLDSSLLTISAKGGKGGNTSNLYGEGGGGGGGFILTNNPTDPGNVTKTTAGGIGGTRSNATTGSSGTAGMSVTTFAPTLNGFLFNTIKSEVTGNLIDSICSNVPFGNILGTKPVGGVEGSGYHYQWQSSTLASPVDADYVAAAGVNDQQNYSPGLLTQTTWFRRVVTDNGTPLVLTDKSTPIKIIVQQAITGNLVGKDTTICYNQNPLPLVPLNAGPSNGSSKNYYLYKWIQNTTNTNWNTSPDATGTFNKASYDPPALTITGPNYYQRVVTSGRCISYSSTVTITVLPLITGNITARPDSVICEGSLFNNLGASAPGGGDLVTYKYQWQDSITSSVWKPAVGLNTATGYIPDTSTFSVVENRYIRRVVFSGPDSVCKSKSVPILLTRYHKIKSNSIASDQTICSGTSPVPLTGTIPIQGKSGSYTYIWQDSIKNGVWTNRGVTDFTHAPGNLTDTTWYRRIVNSSKCTNASLPIRVNVHKPIASNTISVLAGGLTDTIICNGQTPHLLKGSIPTGGTNIPGSYIYQWKFSTDNVTYNTVATAGTTTNYQPPALTATTYYKREVTSGTCSLLSSAITIQVLPLITNNTISANQTICYNTVPTQLTGTAPADGAGPGSYTYYWEQSSDGGTTWSVISGAVSPDYSPPALTIPMKYRRTVTSGLSGCCTNISNIVTISQYPPLPTGKITNIADTSICGGLQVLLKVELTGVSPWKVTYKENSVDSPIMPATTAKTTFTVTPATVSTLDVYSYSVAKVEDANGCIATSLTGTKKANVYHVPKANITMNDSIVCGPVIDLKATPSYGTGLWKYPAAVVTSTANGPTVTATIDDIYVDGKIKHNFTWEETNWNCKSQDVIGITFYRKIASVEAGLNTTLYSFDNIFSMSASPPEPWETGLWSVLSGSGDFDNSTLYNTKVLNLDPDVTNSFKWYVENGECNAEDIVNIDVDDIFIPEGFSPDGNGVNDIFEVKGLDLDNQDAELKIVNGAGSEVFSTAYRSGQDKKVWKPWDGKNSNGYDLPEGTYYYLLKLTSLGNGKVFKKSGFIILKRY